MTSLVVVIEEVVLVEWKIFWESPIISSKYLNERVII